MRRDPNGRAHHPADRFGLRFGEPEWWTGIISRYPGWRHCPRSSRAPPLAGWADHGPAGHRPGPGWHPTCQITRISSRRPENVVGATQFSDLTTDAVTGTAAATGAGGPPARGRVCARAGGGRFCGLRSPGERDRAARHLSVRGRPASRWD